MVMGERLLGSDLSILHVVTQVETSMKATGEPGTRMAELGQLVLELPVGHSRSFAVNDAKVELGHFLDARVAVNACPIEHEASACGVPFLRFVFLLRVLLLDIV